MDQWSLQSAEKFYLHQTGEDRFSSGVKWLVESLGTSHIPDVTWHGRGLYRGGCPNVNMAARGRKRIKRPSSNKSLGSPRLPLKSRKYAGMISIIPKIVHYSARLWACRCWRWGVGNIWFLKIICPITIMLVRAGVSHELILTPDLWLKRFHKLMRYLCKSFPPYVYCMSETAR